MSLDKIKARQGALSDAVLQKIALISPGSYKLLTRDMPKLISIAEAASSIASEEDLNEYLCSYIMGVELIDRLDKLKDKK